MIDPSFEEIYRFEVEVKRLARLVYGNNIKSLKIAFNSEYDDEGYDHELKLHAVSLDGYFLEQGAKTKVSNNQLFAEIKEFYGLNVYRWDADDEDSVYNEPLDDYIIIFD